MGKTVNIDLGIKEETEKTEEVYWGHFKFKVVIENGKPKIVPMGSGYCAPVNKPQKPKKEKRGVVVSTEMEVEEGEF